MSIQVIQNRREEFAKTITQLIAQFASSDLQLAKDWVVQRVQR